MQKKPIDWWGILLLATAWASADRAGKGRDGGLVLPPPISPCDLYHHFAAIGFYGGSYDGSSGGQFPDPKNEVFAVDRDVVLLGFALYGSGVCISRFLPNLLGFLMPSNRAYPFSRRGGDDLPDAFCGGDLKRGCRAVMATGAFSYSCLPDVVESTWNPGPGTFSGPWS